MDEQVSSDEQTEPAEKEYNREAAVDLSDLWAADIPMYRTWFEFMACSPSYELARRFRTNQLTKAEAATLPTDIDEVLEVYDDFGNLKDVTFRNWWNKKAKKYFGAKSSTPLVTEAKRTYPNSSRAPDNADDMDMDMDIFRGRLFREEQGWARETSRTLRFSTALKRKDVLREIKTELDKLEFEQQPKGDLKAKYPMQKIGKMRSALEKYLRTLKNRAKYPDEELWSIGVRSNMTEAAKTWPYTDGQPDRPDEKDRQAIAIATSRALLRARMICEHAARGRFPVHTQLETALGFVSDDLSQCVLNIDQFFAQEVADREISRKKMRALMIEYGVTPKGRFAPE